MNNEKSSPNNTGGIFMKILSDGAADTPYPLDRKRKTECQAALKKIFDNGRHFYINQDDIRITIEED